MPLSLPEHHSPGLQGECFPPSGPDGVGHLRTRKTRNTCQALARTGHPRGPGQGSEETLPAAQGGPQPPTAGLGLLLCGSRSEGSPPALWGSCRLYCSWAPHARGECMPTGLSEPSLQTSSYHPRGFCLLTAATPLHLLRRLAGWAHTLCSALGGPTAPNTLEASFRVPAPLPPATPPSCVGDNLSILVTNYKTCHCTPGTGNSEVWHSPAGVREQGHRAGQRAHKALHAVRESTS